MHMTMQAFLDAVATLQDAFGFELVAATVETKVDGAIIRAGAELLCRPIPGWVPPAPAPVDVPPVEAQPMAVNPIDAHMMALGEGNGLVD